MDDMNATPVNKLSAPMLSSSNEGSRPSGGPPSYTELLKEMQSGPPQQPRFGGMGMADSSDDDDDEMIEEIQELPPRRRVQKSVHFAPMAAMQPVQQYMQPMMPAMQQQMQQPMQQPMQQQMQQPMQQAPKAGRPKPKLADGIKGLLMKNKTILVIAFAAFVAMVYGAPRLRTIPQFMSSSGGLNMLGIAALSLAVGASSELAKFVG
jgi:hypothetical protein